MADIVEWLCERSDDFDLKGNNYRIAADEIKRLRYSNSELMREVSRLAREAGEAKGRLEASELPGVLDSWRDECERLRAENARLREALVEAEKALIEARKHELEECETVGYTEEELPEGCFDYIDAPLRNIRAALVELLDADTYKSAQGVTLKSTERLTKAKIAARKALEAKE